MGSGWFWSKSQRGKTKELELVLANRKRSVRMEVLGLWPEKIPGLRLSEIKVFKQKAFASYKLASIN